MTKQFFLLGAVVVFGLIACNDSGTDGTTTTDSTTTTTTNVEKKGTQIANFTTRTFMDLKTNKPIVLHWDTTHYYYVDESGNQPYFYYDPASKDTFDYWGRRLNSYLNYSNGEYMVDESRLPVSDAPVPVMDSTTPNMDTTSATNSGNLKVKSTDDKYKEKTDTTKLKVTDDKMKAKKK